MTPIWQLFFSQVFHPLLDIVDFEIDVTGRVARRIPSATVVMKGAARQTHSTSYMKVSRHFEADILL